MSSPRRPRLLTFPVIVAVSLMIAWILPTYAVSTAVDLDDWSTESYSAVSGFGAGTWTVAGDGLSVLQSTNGQPTLFYSDFDAYHTTVTGKVQVASGAGDDDYIGFVLGYQPGDASSYDADYLLIDWKKGTQFFDFGSPSNTPGSTANEGLAVSRVFGNPTADEFWGHENFDHDVSDLDNGLEEIARGTSLGNTGWAHGAEYTFQFDFTPTSLKVWVDGNLEIDVAGDYNDGRLGFYNFSQAGVAYSAFTVEFNEPPTVIVDNPSVSADEGQLATNTGTYDDANVGDHVVLSASVGDVSKTGTNNGSWSWSYDATDGPSGSQVEITADDGNDGITLETFDLTINNVDPTAVLAAPDDLMEGDSFSLSLTDAFDPSDADMEDGLLYSFNCGDGNGYSSPSTLSTFNCFALDNPDQFVMGRVIDKDGGETEYQSTVPVSNVAPLVGEITAPVDPVEINTEITASADFTDLGKDDTHAAVWDWGDSNHCATEVDTTCEVVQGNGEGVAAGRHAYDEPGVYTVSLTVTDDDNDSDTTIYQYVTVYDPDGGSVRGNGTIDSPAGACQLTDECKDITGTARFGFTAKYKPGTNDVTGKTQFRLQAAGIRFQSSSYDWLVVGGARAQFKGSGTINGMGSYTFLLTAVDGDINGGGQTDAFRIKIKDTTTDTVVYDNHMGESDDSNPTTGLTQGSITIRNK